MKDDLAFVLDGERRKIAKALHDGVCQDLTAAAMLAEIHVRKLEQFGGSEVADAAHIRDLLKTAVFDLQKALALLHGPKDIPRSGRRNLTPKVNGSRA